MPSDDEHGPPRDSRPVGPIPDGGPEPGAPPPPPFDPHDELIGNMERPPRWIRERDKLEREARARTRRETWDRRLSWFRSRQHAPK
jgi:hypothetical protein